MLRMPKSATLLLATVTAGVFCALLIGPAQASVQKQAVINSAVISAAPDYSCYFPITGFYCLAQTLNGHAPLFRSNGSRYMTLPLNDKVKITCYYKGNPSAPWHGDGYMDHVTWENISNPITGHIPDYYVNLDGNTPGQAGIPPC
jgi:hypothetical protein